MKTPLIGLLSVLAIVSVADAKSPARSPATPRPGPEAEHEMAPLRQAATDCFAETVLANPRATGHARAGRWIEAAGVIGFLCRPEVDAMVQAHDRLYGKGTGERFFKGPYARHLDGQLAARLQPLLERKAVASAEAPIEKAAAEDVPSN